MIFRMLTSNGHNLEWDTDNGPISFSSPTSAVKWFFESSVVQVRHLGSGRDIVWINPQQVVFMEKW